MGNQNIKLESGHYTFWKCYIQVVIIVLITPSFSEHPRFQEKMTFAEAFLVNRGKSKFKK